MQCALRTNPLLEVVEQVIVLGARNSQNRSLLNVNEDFANECNAKISLLYGFYFVSGSRCLPYLTKFLTVVNSPHHLLSQRIVECIIVWCCQNKTLVCKTESD